MRRAFSLITVLILLVVGGLFVQLALAGDFTFRLFGFHNYPLPEWAALQLGPLFAALSTLPGLGWITPILPQTIPSAILFVGLVLLLVGGTAAVGIGLAVWTTRTTFEMVKERSLPKLSDPKYKGQPAPTGTPISDRVALILVAIGLVLGSLWALTKATYPLPDIGTMRVPIPSLDGLNLVLTPTDFPALPAFAGLLAVAVGGTAVMGWLLAFWFRRTTEEMEKPGMKPAPATAPAGATHVARPVAGAARKPAPPAPEKPSQSE